MLAQVKTFFGLSTDSLLFKLVASLIIFLVAKLIVAIIRKSLTLKILNKVKDDTKALTIKNIIFNVVFFVVYFLAALYILDLFGVNTSSLLATAGIGGIAIAFGSQQLVKDFIMGAIIIFEDQFRVGEYISISGVEGYVIDIGLRTTKLQDFSGKVHTLQNGDIRLVTNMSRTPQRVKVTVLLPFDTDLDKLYRVVEGIIEESKSEFVHVTEGPKIFGVTNFNDLSFELTLVAFATEEEHYAIEKYFRKRILEVFHEEGIEFLSFKGAQKNEIQDQ